ncbi:MAG: OmpA family protein [Acetobacteraceae bacterium]
MRRIAFLLMMLVATVSGARAADQPAQVFVIYFQEWSVAIDTEAQKVIKQAADMAKANRKAQVQVTGFADPTGSRISNVMLSELRAQRVADYLTDDGVPKARLHLRGKGPVQFAISGLESRRVEITVTPE